MGIIEGFTTISVAIIGMASGWGIALINKGWRPFSKKANDPIRKLSKNVSENVQPVLDTVRKELQCDRVAVLQFHNGERYHTGSHIQKASQTHESVGAGVSLFMPKFQNVPITQFSWWLEETLNMRFAYQETQDIPDFVTRGTLASEGVRSALSVPIEKDGKVVAILSAAWINRVAPVFCDDHNATQAELLDTLRQRVAALSDWL